MVKNILFEGAATALITPFDENGALNLECLERLIERQIEGGISALVLAGTTGEASTLSFEEYSQLIAFGSSIIRHRVPLIAGAGSNNTAKALKWSLEAEKRGADAVLSVTPYYNKTTQEGLYLHYKTIMDRIKIPAILYHIPGRTGMKMNIDTICKLAENPRIIGLKEASGDLSFAAHLASKCDLPLYSGNDDQILPLLSLGGMGVISVLSNLLPREVQNICKFYKQGELKKATALQLEMIPLINLLFSSVNPIPVKKAMEIMGFSCGKPRLPLVECDKATETALVQILRQFGI